MTKHLHYTLVLLLFILIGGGKISGQTTETVTFKDLYGSNTISNVTDKETDNVKLTYNKNNGTNSPAYNQDGTIRLYKQTGNSNGCSMTITAKNGLTITSVAYDFAKNVNHSFTADDGKESTSNTDTKWEGNSLFVTIKNTSGTNGGDQLRINSVTITFDGNAKTPTTITFGESTDNTTITVKEGEESAFTAPKATLTPEEAGTITYSSNNTDVASVDAATGDITFGSVFGTTTITAKYEGNDTYASSEAEYTIKYKSNIEPIFYESFDNNNNTGGNDNVWSGINGGSGNIVADNEGWAFNKYSYAASECARFGTSNDAGSATTPEISGLSGNATLTFKAGAWDKDDEQTTLTLSIANGGEIDKNTVELVKGQWTEYTINITNGTPTSQITFKGNGKNNRFFLDEVTIVATKNNPTVNFDETKENTITAAENVTVSLVRTLDNSDWNTFCVPFDISEEQVKAVFGEGTKITEFTSADQVQARMIFSNAQSIKAGVPYFIKPGKAEVKNPSFEGVTIVEGEPKTITNNSNYSFVGVYSPYKMKTDGTELFIGAGGSLVAPAEESNTINGMRAFIRLSSKAVIKPSIDIDGNGTTGISIIENDTTSNGNVYDINGRLAGKNKQGLKKGIYIVNGKKIIIK